MEKKTATERLMGMSGVFTQLHGGKEATDEPEEEPSKPKSRSARAFLDSLKEEQQ